MTNEQLDQIAVEVVNFLAEKKVSVGEVERVFKSAEYIIQLETKVKKIES